MPVSLFNGSGEGMKRAANRRSLILAAQAEYVLLGSSEGPDRFHLRRWLPV